MCREPSFSNQVVFSIAYMIESKVILEKIFIQEMNANKIRLIYLVEQNYNKMEYNYSNSNQ